MRRNSCTVIVLAGPVPLEVLGAVDRSMNVTLVRPTGSPDPAGPDLLSAAADALRRASRATSPYALVTADPLAAVAEGWQAMWDLAHPQGPARFEQEAAVALAAWRSGQFELPDYYLAIAPHLAVGPHAANAAADIPEPDFYLGPLRAARPHRVAVVPAAEPDEQAAAVLTTLGSLRHGPWWPALDDLLSTARTFYPGQLPESSPASGPAPATPHAAVRLRIKLRGIPAGVPGRKQ